MILHDDLVLLSIGQAMKAPSGDLETWFHRVATLAENSGWLAGHKQGRREALTDPDDALDGWKQDIRKGRDPPPTEDECKHAPAFVREAVGLGV